MSHPTPTIYTLSLHDALPIYGSVGEVQLDGGLYNHLSITERRPAPLSFMFTKPGDTTSDVEDLTVATKVKLVSEDRKSTRLNSSHSQISYAVFCLKKKTKNIIRAIVPSSFILSPITPAGSAPLSRAMSPIHSVLPSRLCTLTPLARTGHH